MTLGFQQGDRVERTQRPVLKAKAGAQFNHRGNPQVQEDAGASLCACPAPLLADQQTDAAFKGKMRSCRASHETLSESGQRRLGHPAAATSTSRWSMVPSCNSTRTR